MIGGITLIYKALKKIMGNCMPIKKSFKLMVFDSYHINLHQRYFFIFCKVPRLVPVSCCTFLILMPFLKRLSSLE